MIGGGPAIRGRLASCLLLLTLLASCRAVAANDYGLSLLPAWEGRIKPGTPSELGLRLVSSHGSQVTVTLRGSEAIVHRDATLEPGRPIDLYLPLAHDTISPAVVELQVDGVITAKKNLELQVLAPSTKVIADIGTGLSVKSLPTDATVIYAEADQLPHTGQAYQLISSLLLAESALITLDEEQWKALAGYAANCGLLYMSAFTTDRARALRGMAGCGGRNLLTLSSYMEDTFRVPSGTSRLPAASTLRSLLPSGSNPVLRPLQVFLVGYVLALLLVARSAKTTTALIALPPVAAALAALAWSLSSPVIRVANWAETESGDSTARFAGLLQVTGAGPREVVLSLPAEWGLPAGTEAKNGAEIKIGQTGQQLDLHMKSHLMSRHDLRVEGIVGGSPLDVREAVDGVNITNRGTTTSAAGVLAWQGKRYGVPALAAGAQWKQPEREDGWKSTPQEQLLRQRSTDGGGWLLVPHDVPALRSLTNDGDATGWLLVKAVSDV